GGGGFDTAANFDAYLWRVARFTILQAIASSLLSVLFAVPVARALYAEASFPGRGLILRLFALPLALPALVAVLGVTSIYGRNG
ncbi:sulfate ABC transporter permease subunit CysT, partial [Jeotgalicoccus huakuii]|nr:sulfate ABC transporter permease subunit CysT [Jeotgalicoccus huakuii]